MIKLRESPMMSHVVRAAAVSILALFLTAPPSSAQSSKPVPAATARDISKKAHRLVLQVNTNEPATMNLALNNATNVEQHYKSLGEKIEIEVVTFGPGLHMLRDDTSPVKDRIKAIAEKNAIDHVQGLWQHAGKYGQGREQGHSACLSGDACEVGRRASHGTAGAGLDLRPALVPPPP